MHRLFLAGEIHGTTHLGAGQEAVAVGSLSRAGARRLPGRHVSGPRARARQGDRSRAAGGRDARPRHRRVRRPCRLDERDRPRARAGRLLRDRRRIDRGRAGRRAVGQAPGPGVGGTVRRRRHQPGVLPRVPEHGDGVLVAGGVRVREQLLRRIHADGLGHRRGRHRGTCARVCNARPRSSTATTSGRCTRPHPRRWRERAPATGRRCSSAGRIAITATPRAIRPRTAPSRRSSSGSSAIR